MNLEQSLRDRRARGAKLFVPYITGGLPGWVDCARAAAEHGADAIEVGIPFSDPVMDGPVIQEASARALAGGATPLSILGELRRLDLGVPVAVMTYFNVVFRMGLRRFAGECVEAGVSAVIVPDLPFLEAAPWIAAAWSVDLDAVLLAAPNTPRERLRQIAGVSNGFVYAVGTVGVTGERDELAATATVVARRLLALTDTPVLVGVGVSTPAQAAEVCEVAEGVVMGSAVVRRMLDGEGPGGVAKFVCEVREALR